MGQRVTNPEDLKRLREAAKRDLELRAGTKEMQVTVHMGTCGIAAGARDVLAKLMDELETEHVDNVTVRQSGCLGLCDQEPMFTVRDKEGHEFTYGRLDRFRVHEIVTSHVVLGRPVAKFLVQA